MLNATAIWPVAARAGMSFVAPKTAAPIAPLGFEVGTGGNATFIYVRSRGNMGYPFAGYEWSGRVADVVAEPTIAENIGRIRAILNPTMTDLAGVLKVSRQAVYDWQAGKPIAAENALKISELARAADLFAFEGLKGTTQVLRRPIKNGKNFFQLVMEGSAADAAARGVIEIVRSEVRQREALRDRLAGRKRPSREEFGEIGAPMLDERE